MKQLLILLVLGAAGYFGYRYLDGLPPTFSVSTSRELGDFDDIDDHLRDAGAPFQKLTDRDTEDLFGSRFVGRGDVSVALYGKTDDGVLTVVSGGGQLLAVGCRFKSGSVDFALGRGAPQRFTGLYWRAVTGGDPSFINTGDELAANMFKGRADCVWIKDASGGRTAVTDRATFLLGKAMLRTEAR
jgi:hypothetical protein